MTSSVFDQFDTPEDTTAQAAGPMPEVVAPGVAAVNVDPETEAVKAQAANWFNTQAQWDRWSGIMAGIGREIETYNFPQASEMYVNPFDQFDEKPPAPAEPLFNATGFLGADFQRGLGGAASALGAGIEQYAGRGGFGSGLQAFGERQKEAAGPMQGPQSVFDIKGIKDAGEWFGRNMMQGIGSSVPTIATALGGALVPGGVAAGVLTSSHLLGVGQVRQALQQEQNELYARSERAARLGLMDLRDQIQKEAGRLDPDEQRQVVLIAGSVIGGLESVTPWLMLVKDAPMKLASELRSQMIRQVVTRIAAKAGQGAATEGVTEALQTVTEVIAVAKVKGAEGALDYLKTLNDQKYRIIDEGLAGAAGGVGFGVIGGVRDASRAIRGGGRDDERQTAALPPEPVPSAGGVELPPGMPVLQATEVTPEQATEAVTTPDPQAEVEQAVAIWRQAQAGQDVAETVAPVAETAEAVATPAAEPLAEAIQSLPPEQQQMAAPALAAAEQASPGITEQINEAIAQAPQQTQQVPAEVQAELERLGIAQARTEDEVRQLVTERQRAVAMAERERQAAAAAQREQRMAPVRQYLADGGRLDRGRYREIARVAGVKESQVPDLLAEAEQAGLVRKDRRGQYRRQLQQPTAGSAREAIQQVARELAPILPKGTVVRSFAELGDIAEASRGGLRQDGDRVVSAASGQAIDAFQDGDVVYLAEYALGSRDARGTLSHEALHALVTAGVVDPKEVATLADRARKTGVFTKKTEAAYEKDYKARFPNDWQRRVDEEAAAALIEARANGADHGRQINGITDRILEFFARLRNALRGRGFRSSDDVMDAFFSGEMARRAAVQDWMRSEDITAMAVRDGNMMAALSDRDTGQAMRRDLDALGFFSGALEAAKGLKQAKGTPEQMLAQLRNAGVKANEIEATKLNEFLAGKTSVTRDEIVAHLEANRVGLREVFRSGTEIRDVAIDPETGQGRQTFRTVGAQEGAVGPAKFSSYSLDPSNPSYRETVLHLPSKMSKAELDRWAESTYGVRWDELSDDARQDVRESQKTDFQSGHFPEPNIVGHMMTSMVKHEGQPTFLIDQIQSDWGQRLRDGGVRDEAKIAELKARIAELKKNLPPQDGWSVKTLGQTDGIGRLIRVTDPSGQVVRLREFQAFNGTDSDAIALAQSQSGDLGLLQAELRTAEAAVSGNPLVNTTDQWTTTTLRRALRQAAEADAEYIAIPSGDTVLSYNPGDEAGMRGFYGKPRATEERLADLREQLVEQEAEVEAASGLRQETAKKRVEALKQKLAAAESFMEGIVPKNLRKLIEKLDKDAPKPQQVTTLEATDGPRGWNKKEEYPFDKAQTGFTLFPLTPAVKAKVRTEGQAMFALSDDRPVTPGLDMSPEARKQRAEQMGFDTGRVWYHGTTATFDAFRTGDRGAVFLADQPYVTEHFANPYKDNNPAQVLPVFIRTNRVFDPAKDSDNPNLRAWVESNIRRYDIELFVPPGAVHKTSVDEVLADLRNSAFGKDMFEPVEHPVIQEWLKQNGYDGFVTVDASWMSREAKTPARIIGLFDPRNIRSINAAFDPANADSPNLMFALRDEGPQTPASLQTIVADLARDLGLTLRQGMRTATARAARRAGLGAIYDPDTGIVRTGSVTDIKSVARAAGQAIAHRFDLDALIAANAADLTLPPANPQQPPAFAAEGFAGLELDAPTLARARDAALALVRASALNAAGQDAAEANATAERAMHDLARRLGRPTAIAVVKDTLGAQKALSTSDQAGLLILSDSPDIATARDITARLDGMPYLPQAVRMHILQGRTPQEMKARARAVVVETIDPAEIRRALAAFDQAAAAPAFSAQDAVRLADSLRIDTTAINDLMARMGAGAVPEIRARVTRLISDAEAAALRPPVVPSLYEAATLPDAEAAARIEARLIERFTPDGTPAPGPAATPADAQELSDAFADWFRDYMVSPSKAEAQAPYLYDQMEAMIDAKDPVLLAKLESSQQAIQAWFQADPAAAVETTVRDALKPGFWDRFGEDISRWGLSGALSLRASNLYTATIDKTNPFAIAVSEALRIRQRNTGAKLDLSAGENAYKLMRLAPHSHAWSARDLEEGVRNYRTGEHEGPGLIAALTEALGPSRATARDVGPGSRYRKFGAYLVAKYASVEWGRFRDGQKERAPTAQPPGTATPDEAIAFYEKVAAQYETLFPSFAPAAQKIYDYQANLLKLQRDAGLISAETYDTLITDTTYVPFYRHFDEQADLSARALSVGPGGILKKKRGSERDIIDPIAGIAQKTFETRQMAASNDVKRALLRLAENAGPGGGVIAERIDPTQLKGTELDIETILRSAARDVDADTRDISQMIDMMQQVLGNDAVATYYTQRHIVPGKRPIVFFFEGGKPQAMQLGDGERGHQLAAQMHDVLNTFGKEHLDMMLEMAALPAQITRIGITTHPEFSAANIVRDAPMAFMYDRRALPIVTQVMGLVDIARGAPHVAKFRASGGMQGGEATSYADKLRTERDIGALIERGYKFKTFDSFGNLFDHLRELFEPRNMKDRAIGGLVGGIAGAAIGGPVGAISGAVAGTVAGGKAIVKLGEVSETATRTRLFKHAYDRAIDAGLDEVAATQEAAFWSHDYTDYSRRGSRMEGAAKLIPFLNANLQGNDVYLRRLMGTTDYGMFAANGLMYPLYRLGMLDATKLSPKEREQLGNSAWTWAMTVLGLGSITAAVAMLWSDDERIKDIDDRVKASHWLIPVDDSLVLRVPKPFQTVWFAQAVERMITDQSSRAKERYFEDLWNTWKPPLVPSAAEVVATMIGYDLNSGREIVPNWMRMADKSRASQYDAYTSEFGKWAGQQLNVSPLYVDHIITKFGATWGRTALSLNVPGTPWYNPQKPTKGPEEELIARRFLWKVGRGSEAGQALREMMGAEDPLPKIWGALAQPITRYASSATAVRELLEKPIPDHAGAVAMLEGMTLKERGYAIMESYFRGRNEAKYRMLHPMNRAEKIGRETIQLEKMLIGGELLTGRKGKDQKRVPLPPAEKAAARDILTQLRMMETHNALVLTKEPGWDNRIMFNTALTLAELKAASPKTHAELMRRYETAGVVSDAGIRRVWDEVKGRIEDPRWLERIRKNQVSGASGMFAAAWVKANAARPATIVQPPERPAPLPGMMRLGGPLPPPEPVEAEFTPRRGDVVQDMPARLPQLERDGEGRVTSAGDVAFNRGDNGRISEVTRGGRTYRVDRDEQNRIVRLTEIR